MKLLKVIVMNLIIKTMKNGSMILIEVLAKKAENLDFASRIGFALLKLIGVYGIRSNSTQLLLIRGNIFIVMDGSSRNHFSREK